MKQEPAKKILKQEVTISKGKKPLAKKKKVMTSDGFMPKRAK